MINAIPTTWNGINFRSRLEARWARFFEACGWNWHYEPLDLAGYIPDFIVQMKHDILFEVKPVLRFDEAEVSKAALKISLSGWTGEFVILGAVFNNPVLGWMHENDDPGWGGAGEAHIGHCHLCNQLSISHSEGWYGCRRCGRNDGSGVGYVKAFTDAWKAAGNSVQWKRP